MFPARAESWTSYAEFEGALGETDRARQLFTLGTEQVELDTPESVWKSFIDFEIETGSQEDVVQLFEKLLERSAHVKVWISYGTYMMTQGRAKGRALFKRAYEELRA